MILALKWSTHIWEIGYNPLGKDKLNASKVDAPSNCRSGVNCQTGYCTMRCEFGTSISTTYYYYRVITYVTLDIPIINKVMSGMTVFQVTGDTMRIPKR